MHKRAHDEKQSELRDGILTVRGLRVASARLGITGCCDVVEFHRAETGIDLPGRSGKWSVFPVEDKHGEKKTDSCDELQLCAQAMCLEEMLCCDIPSGALFYGSTRRREEVAFDERLREQVAASLSEMHVLFSKGYTPKGKQGKHCKSCSLNELCLPGMSNGYSVKEYIEKAVCEN